MMRFTKTWIIKLKSNIEYHWNQETALRSNEETWKTDWKENEDEVILSWRKNIFLNEQHTNKDKKQEIEQQKHRIIHDCKKH